MVKLHEQGAYLVNGTDLIPDSAEALSEVRQVWIQHRQKQPKGQWHIGS